MTVIARTFASIPTRSASETWEAIVDLVAPDTKSAARRELDAVAGTASSCIADEALESDPLVVYGSGPRLRVYALYGDAAIEGDAANESPLSFVPTEGDWHMSIPCLSEDLDWVERSLKAVSRHVRARAQGEQLEEDRDGARSAGTSVARNDTAAPLLVNRDAFFRR
jgi:hypothetical protein